MHIFDCRPWHPSQLSRSHGPLPLKPPSLRNSRTTCQEPPRCNISHPAQSSLPALCFAVVGRHRYPPCSVPSLARSLTHSLEDASTLPPSLPCQHPAPTHPQHQSSDHDQLRPSRSLPTSPSSPRPSIHPSSSLPSLSVLSSSSSSYPTLLSTSLQLLAINPAPPWPALPCSSGHISDPRALNPVLIISWFRIPKRFSHLEFTLSFLSQARTSKAPFSFSFTFPTQLEAHPIPDTDHGYQTYTFLFRSILSGFAVFATIFGSLLFSLIITTVEPVFLLPSRVLAGLETPRTSTVPSVCSSAAFLIGAGSYQTIQKFHPDTSCRPPSLAPLYRVVSSLFSNTERISSHYCFIDVADKSIPTIGSPHHEHWRRFNTSLLTRLSSYQQ